LIGVYSSKGKAEQAIERLSCQPGFKDFPDYFTVDEYTEKEGGCSDISVEEN
jgi:hypothetical protein